MNKSVVKHNRKYHLFIVSAFITAGTLIESGGVSANSSSANVNISAAVVANCRIQGGGPSLSLNFGDYDPANENYSVALSSSGSFDVRCTKGVTAHIGMGNGQNPTQAVGTTRAMTNGTDYLSYELYTNAGMTTVWNSINTVSYEANSNTPFTMTLYAKVPPNQDVAVGNYTDIVEMSVNF